MNRILVVIPVEEKHKRYLEDLGKSCQFEYARVKNVTEEQVRRADIIIGNVSTAMLKEAECLQWIQLNSAGADAYCKPGILKDGVILTNATGAYGLAISEYMVGMSFMLQNKLYQYYRNQMGHEWKDMGKVTSVYGSTTLVIGLGDIGGEYAARMKALGSYTIGVKRTPGEKPEYLDELYTTERLDELLPRADFVSLSLPNTPNTIHLMDERRLRLMKPGAFLLNVGRGSAIDTDALCKVLEEGHLGGCGVDVTDPEPLPADHPLWDAPGMVITPHISGNYHLQETFERIVRIAGRNLEKFLAGQKAEMENQVDFQTGYRRK
ncbi:MAG: D-2-hydroxyacid dehydrogenase [Hungatella sp.]|nr:D-2-hydroxyacid dehydrogenase [Hungatella sp.]